MTARTARRRSIVFWFFLWLLALPAAAQAARNGPVEPPLPPLELAFGAPLVEVAIAGQPIVLRIDPDIESTIVLNASAAARLRLDDPARQVDWQLATRGSQLTRIGRTTLKETTIRELAMYRGRTIPVILSWSAAEHVKDADGLIPPHLLPHDVIRLIRRPADDGDRTMVLAMRQTTTRGLLGSVPVGSQMLDIAFQPSRDVTIATAAGAAYVAAAHGGRLQGASRMVRVSRDVERPVRTVILKQPFDILGLRVTRFDARIADWSGGKLIPEEAAPEDEIVVLGRVRAQRLWAKLTIGEDLLRGCASLAWQRTPLAILLTCPELPID